MKMGQSAGNSIKMTHNLISQAGSSETIREVSFNFERFVQNSVSHKKNFSQKELEWVVGFAEGDGSFIVSKNRNFFILTQKSFKILSKVKSILGFGSVTKAGEYFRYIVADHKGVFNLVCLFNGNLVLNKTNARFKLWLQNYIELNLNLSEKEKELLCYKESRQLTSYKKSGWLAGFIDAEGCFHAQFRKDRILSVRVSLFIDQVDEQAVLNGIATNFGGYVVDRITSVENVCFRVSISNELGILAIIKYLQQYPLLGDKKISFLRWKRLFETIKVYKEKREEKQEELNLEKLRNLCKNINKR